MNFKTIFKENILFIVTLLTIFFLDRYAKIKIHAKCDDVMEMLMEKLKI